MNKKVEPQDRKILLSENVELGEKTPKGQTVTDPNILFNEIERTPSFLTGSEATSEVFWDIQTHATITTITVAINQIIGFPRI